MKILILGANQTECFVVKRAKELGYYTIVTDNNIDRTNSPAKDIADESWDISWSDIDSLAEKCRQEKVDGIIAGFSEFRVENQIRLCERLNLPCPITIEQLNITRDKNKFKAECVKYNIPLVPEYSEESALDNLPVIVKPVDRAGSIGINVAYTKSELSDACQIAREASPTNSIIIEKYMSGCIKFDVYYVIQEGKISLIGSSDTLMCPPNKGHEVLQAAWLFPSRYENAFKSKCNSQVESFIKGIGIRNGYITISAFVDGYENFFVFETGFRLSGELSFMYSEQAYGINYIDFLLSYSVGSHYKSMDYSHKISNDKLLVINHFANDGEIAVSEGLSFKSEHVNTYDYLGLKRRLHNPNGNGVGKVAMSFIQFNKNQSAVSASSHLNDSVALSDCFNRDLVYYRIPDIELKNFLS